MPKVILNEEAIKQLEAILGETPFKHAAPIMQILNQNYVADSDPIGGGGSGPQPPKPKPTE